MGFLAVWVLDPDGSQRVSVKGKISFRAARDEGERAEVGFSSAEKGRHPIGRLQTAEVEGVAHPFGVSLRRLPLHLLAHPVNGGRGE
jgi:hypothetical protein